MVLRIAFGFSPGVGRLAAARWCQQKYGGHVIGLYDPVKEMIKLGEKITNTRSRNPEQLTRIINRSWGHYNKTSVWPQTLINNMPTREHVFVYDLEWPCHAKYLASNGFKIVRILGNETLGSWTKSARHKITNQSWDYIIKNRRDFNAFTQQLNSLKNLGD